jgi:D-cysteine desulfhydrase family pyridoxal phosphate-dependent enzyme
MGLNEPQRSHFGPRFVLFHRALVPAALCAALLSACAGSGPPPSTPSPPGDPAVRLAQRYSRVPLSHLPTPLEELETLSADLGGPRILVKRDDQTGLAFGGNKARKLEYILADALDEKADVVITWGGLQSNWCRQTAAAAAALGMRAILLLARRDDGPVVTDGNLLLDEILGAEVHILEPGTDQAEVAEKVAEEERARGHTPYVVSVGGSRPGGSMEEPLGALGYVTAFLETYSQVRALGIEPDYMVFPTGSGGTQAGLIIGAAAAGASTKIVGISVSGSAESIKSNVARIATQTAEAMDLSASFSADDLIVFDEYVGEGYGILNHATADAIRRVARGEGILLDPVYTGKAMAGLIDLVEKGYFTTEDVVVFIHTGGTPDILHYGEGLLSYLPG